MMDENPPKEKFHFHLKLSPILMALKENEKDFERYFLSQAVEVYETLFHFILSLQN